MPKRIHHDAHPQEDIVSGPLRLERPTWELREPPVRTVEDEIVRALQAAARWNELQALRAQ